jgi:hypothetical protein
MGAKGTYCEVCQGMSELCTQCKSCSCSCNFYRYRCRYCYCYCYHGSVMEEDDFVSICIASVSASVRMWAICIISYIGVLLLRSCYLNSMYTDSNDAAGLPVDWCRWYHHQSKVTTVPFVRLQCSPVNSKADKRYLI